MTNFRVLDFYSNFLLIWQKKIIERCWLLSPKRPNCTFLNFFQHYRPNIYKALISYSLLFVNFAKLAWEKNVTFEKGCIYLVLVVVRSRWVKSFRFVENWSQFLACLDIWLSPYFLTFFTLCRIDLQMRFYHENSAFGRAEGCI